MVGIEVKSSDFHFFKKEYPFACATVQFDWIFLNSAWYKNGLITPGVIYRFCRINFLNLHDLKALKILCNEYFSQIVSCYIAFDTLGVLSQNNWKIGPLQVQELKPWYRVLYFRETVLNVTFNGNPIGNWLKVYGAWLFFNIYHNAKRG